MPLPASDLFPLRTETLTLDADTASRLQYPSNQHRVIELHPPPDQQAPTALPELFQALRTPRTDWTRVRNRSACLAIELHRPHPDTLHLQAAVPTARHERILRLQLADHVPGITFSDGISGLPVDTGTTVAGGLITTTHQDWYPLRIDRPNPLLNAVVAALHPHAMQDTRVVIQLLCKPVTGHPVRRWWWHRRSANHCVYLRKEKERLWGNRSPTNRERQQARAITHKSSQSLWWCSIRLFIAGQGATSHTQSRLQELATAFRGAADPETGQALTMRPVRPWRASELRRFCQAIADRRFASSSARFRITDAELGALASVPTRQQSNLTLSEP
ncbi:hypothetical protein [Halomontanus rarus]|uniref:hypothetical protein n=1 Tax=Halomontanus rarus TaxID=3034020 RepID=UPI001A99E69E